MAKFWIDFSASILVEAETREEAEEKFWNCNKLDDIAIEWDDFVADYVIEEEEEED